MLQVISIAGLTIPVGPLAFLLSFVLGSELASRALGKIAPEPDIAQWKGAMDGAMLWALLAGLVTARLAYVVRFSELYMTSPQLALSPRPGSLMLMPGLLGGGAVLFLIMARNNIPLARLADALAVGAAGALTAYYIGQFLTGAGYGLPTELPWGVELWGTVRHPVQIYEAAAAAGILLFLWMQLSVSQPGEVFWDFVTLYSISVLILTGFRSTSATWIQGVRIAQVISLATLLMGLYILSFYALQSEVHTETVATGKAKSG